jgi:hypothetical protein
MPIDACAAKAVEGLHLMWWRTLLAYIPRVYRRATTTPIHAGDDLPAAELKHLIEAHV